MKAQIKIWRKAFNSVVLKRDNHRCRVCGDIPNNGDEGLDVHHISDRHDMPNGGYVAENGIALCKDGLNCHLKAEAEHNGLIPDPGYSRAELYNLIGSSFEKAIEASKKLSS